MCVDFHSTCFEQFFFSLKFSLSLISLIFVVSSEVSNGLSGSFVSLNVFRKSIFFLNDVILFDITCSHASFRLSVMFKFVSINFPSFKS